MAWWLLQNFVIAGLLAGLVQVACRLGRIGPVGRHALWLIVLAKLVTPPVVVLHWPWPGPVVSDAASLAASAAGDRAARETQAPRVVESTAATLSVNGIDAPGPALLSEFASQGPTSPQVGRSARPSDVAPGLAAVRAVRIVLSRLAGVWTEICLLGGLVFAGFQGIRILRVVRRLRSARPPEEGFREQVDLLALRLRIRPLQTRVVAGLASPLIWSVNPFRPQLLWPATLPPGLSEDCQRGLMVHELAHVKRRDHWVGWLELAASCAAWWNPLFWYVRSRLREDAELACDGWVVSELPDGRRAYAEALLAVCAAEPSRSELMPVVGVSTGGRRVLEKRLAMIMRERVPLRLSRPACLGLVILTFATLPAWARHVEGAPPAGRDAGDAIRPGEEIGRAFRADLRVEPDSAAFSRASLPGPTPGQTFAPLTPRIDAVAGPVPALDADVHVILWFDQTSQFIVAPQVAAGSGPAESLTLNDAVEAAVSHILPSSSLTLDDDTRAEVARNRLVSNVSNAYWDLVYATEAVEAARQSLALATKLVEDNTIKVQVGTLAPLDVVSARASQATRQRALSTAELIRGNTENVLKRLIAGSVDDPNWTAPLDPIDRGFEPGPVDVGAAIQGVLDRALRSQPADAGGDAFSRTIELQVVYAIAEAAGAVQSQVESVRSAQSLRERSQQRLELEQRKFDAGTSSNYNLVQYQRDLNDARVSELRAILAYRKAQVAFESAQEAALLNAKAEPR